MTHPTRYLQSGRKGKGHVDSPDRCLSKADDVQGTGLVMVHIVVRPKSRDKAHRKNQAIRIFKRSSNQLENKREKRKELGKKANINTKLNVATLKKI